MEAWQFFKKTVSMVFFGSKAYYLWCAFLFTVIGVAITFYIGQLDTGLIVTNMRDQVSWGLYIGNFTYLVGVAASAVLLVIPSYIYHFDPIKEIVVIGELLAASAIIMALMFVLADLGRPDRFWHIIPFIGILSFPKSLLAWDVVVLNGYLILNTIVPIYILVKTYFGKEPNKKFVIPLVLLSIPWAVGIHTVTAFLYNGLAARPLGEIYEYLPNSTEIAISLGIWAFGLLIFTLFMRVALPIQTGDFTHAKYKDGVAQPHQYNSIKP
ncbi:MAG: polysulfide reductase NrfD [Syntrophales bacterium LBB04]|nr:polysulfide reductase NrfD [Syntrophales bacterium LBB04]